jgi:hypothetical protein
VKGLTAGSYFLVLAKEGLGAKDLQNVAAGTKDLVVTIPPGADVWVRCTDAVTGAPVKEFTLRPFRKMPFAYLYAPVFEARSDDGVFKVALLPASDYGAEVTAPGHALASVATLPLSPPEPFEVRLAPAGVVRGRVVERDGGRPVRGASVYVKRGGFPPTKMKDQRSSTSRSRRSRSGSRTWTTTTPRSRASSRSRGPRARRRRRATSPSGAAAASRGACSTRRARRRRTRRCRSSSASTS